MDVRHGRFANCDVYQFPEISVGGCVSRLDHRLNRRIIIVPFYFSDFHYEL